MKSHPFLNAFYAISLLVAAESALSAAPFGSAFTYQGRLNFNGAPAADGFYDFSFSLHDAATLGAPVGAAVAVNAVAVSNGVFTAQLDFGADAFTSGEARWLQLQVNTNGVTPLATLNPRQRLSPTPQAIYVGTAGVANAVAPGAVTTHGLAPDAVDADNILDGTVGEADLAPSILNNTFWRLRGNSGTGNFIGTSDDQPLEFRAGNQTALRLLPNATSPGFLGGHPSNRLIASAAGAFIGGGGAADGSNFVSGSFGAVVGGLQNAAFGTGAFVGGGLTNGAAGTGAFLGGGSRNVSSAPYSTVAGGYFNLAFDTNGTVAGGNGNRIFAGLGGSTIGGGMNNTVDQQQAATIAGGIQNNVAGASPTAAIGGGYQNYIVTNGYGGTIGGGYFNLLTASFASIGGGQFNSAHGASSAIGGGERNVAIANSAFVGGGQSNVAGGVFSMVAGGSANLAASDYTVVAGGLNNLAAEWFAGVGSGRFNTNRGQGSFIAGGENNHIGTNSYASAISGGVRNRIGDDAPSTAISGGGENTIGSQVVNSTIGGGVYNFIGGGSTDSTISGGSFQSIGSNSDAGTIAGGGVNSLGTNSQYATIGGGLDNSTAHNARYATIPGGRDNIATNYAFAAGRRAKAIHDGSFVWADDTDADFASTANKQFAVRANNGVFIQATNTAIRIRGGGALQVEGAGVNSSTPIFTHRATAANIAGPETRIDHPHCNFKPSAILILTYNFNPAGTAGIRNDRPFGLYYNPTSGRWAIYNLDNTAMPVGAAYNILVANP